MSIYIALGLGGMGIKNKVILDREINFVVPRVDVNSTRGGALHIKDNSDSPLDYLASVPGSIGYKHIVGPWQYKVEVAGDATAFKAFEKSHTTVRNLGHVKFAGGYTVKENVVVSVIGGLSLAHLTKWRANDQHGNHFDVVQQDGKEACGLGKEVFLGIEGQYKVIDKGYVTVALQAGLPFMNKVTSIDSAFKAEKRAQLEAGTVIGVPTLYNDLKRNVAASFWTGRIIGGFMYEIGGF